MVARMGRALTNTYDVAVAPNQRHLMERFLIVAPAVSRTPPLGWIELLITLGYVGVFTLSIGRFPERSSRADI